MFCIFFQEYLINYIMKIKNKKKCQDEKSQNLISIDTLTLLKNIIEILNDIIILLKEKFIIK